jgi:hypothetical protein
MIKKRYFNEEQEKTIYAKDVKCSKCNRLLRSPSEWLGHLENALCEDCYNCLVSYSNTIYE